MNIFEIFAVFVCVVSLTLIILEFLHISVFGKLIRSDLANKFIDKHLDSYKLNKMNSDKRMFYGDINMPYIAMSESLLSRWYISNNIGTIPKWSRASRQLDLMREIYIEKKEKPITINEYLK